MQQSSGLRATGRGGGLPWFSKSKNQNPPQNPATAHPPGMGIRNVRSSPPPPASFPPLPAEPPPNGVEVEVDDDQNEEESEYEEIDHLPQYSNGDGNMTRPVGVKWICSLCGSCNPAVRCQMCNNQLFCGACNEMYHRHPQRHCHVRKLLEVVHSRPPLPPKAFQQQQQRGHDAPPIPVHMNSNAASGLGVVSRTPSPHHFSAQFLDGQGLPVPPPRRNRKFGSTSNLRSANNSPTLTRKFSFGFDPFGSLKRLVKGNSNAENPSKSAGKPAVAPAPAPINKIAEVPILHNAWRQDLNAKRQQKQFQQILSNAAASASLQRLNESDEFAFARPSIPTTVLEFGARGNSRSFANLSDPHSHHAISNRDGGHRGRQWEDEDNEIRHITRNDMIIDHYERQRSQFNNHSTSATNLHRIPTANPVPPFSTLQRQTRNSISGPAPAPAASMQFKPPIQPPPPIPPKEFLGGRQNDRYAQEQMFQSAYELNRAGAFVPWVRPTPGFAASGFQEFHEQQQFRPPVQNQNSFSGAAGRQAAHFDNSLPADFDARRGSEPVFHPRQELTYGNDSLQPSVERYYNNSGNEHTQEMERPKPMSQAPAPPPTLQQKPRPNPKPQKSQQSGSRHESDVVKSPLTSKATKQHQHQDQQRNAEAQTVTTTFKVTETPEGPWSCEHCTFVNPKSTNICTICCKTPAEGYRTVCTVVGNGNTNLRSSPRNAAAAVAKIIQNKSQSTQAKSKFVGDDKPKKKLAKSPPPPPAQPSSSESESESESGDEDQSESEESSSGNEDVIVQKLQPQTVPPKKAPMNNEKKVYSRQNSREMKKGNGTGPAGPVKAPAVNKASNVTRKIAAVEQKVTANQKGSNKTAVNSKTSKVSDKSSKGTSPPPQETSTQTYEAMPPKSRGQSIPKSALANHSQSQSQSQSTTSSSREESPPPAARIAMSEKAMRYARRAQQQSKLKRSASAHLASAEIDEPWAFNEFHHHPNYHRRFHNQGHHQDYEGRHMYRSSSRHSLASDTRSLPVSGPPSRDTSPSSRRYYDDLRGHGVIPLKASWDRFPSPGDYFASIEDLVSRKRHESIKSQEFELSRLLKEAEELSYSPEDVQVALKMCGDRNPIKWLQENWSSMVETVQTLATKYGREKGQEQNDVGTISSSEAKEALRHHRGNVWAAVTECVETRRRKFSELQSRGTFLREDILTALTAHHGNLDAAYVELSKAQLKPFLMRIWGPPSGHENEASAPRTDSVLSLLSLDLVEQQKQIQNNPAQVAPLTITTEGSSQPVFVQQHQQVQNLATTSTNTPQVQGQVHANETVMQTRTQTQAQIQPVSEISAGPGPVLGSQVQAQITFNEKAPNAFNANTEKPELRVQNVEMSTQTFAAAPLPSAPSPSAAGHNVIITATANENHVKCDPACEDETFVDASSDLNLNHSLDPAPARKESPFSNASSASASVSTSTSSSDPDLLLDESHISHFIQNFLVPEPPPYEYADPIPTTAKETRTLPKAPALMAASPTTDFLEASNAHKVNENETTSPLKGNEVTEGATTTLLPVPASTPSATHSPQSSMSLPSPCCSSSMSFAEDGGGTRTSSELEKLFDDSRQRMVSPQSQLENLAKAMNIISAKLGVLLVKQEAAQEGTLTATALVAPAPTLIQQESFQGTLQKNEEATQEFQAQVPDRILTAQAPILEESPETISTGMPINLDAPVISPPDEFNDVLQQSQSEPSTNGTQRISQHSPKIVLSVAPTFFETSSDAQAPKDLSQQELIAAARNVMRDDIPEVGTETNLTLTPTQNQTTSSSNHLDTFNAHAKAGRPEVQKVLIKEDGLISNSGSMLDSQLIQTAEKETVNLQTASSNESDAKNDKVAPVVLESQGMELADKNLQQDHSGLDLQMSQKQATDAPQVVEAQQLFSVVPETGVTQPQPESYEHEKAEMSHSHNYAEMEDNQSGHEEEFEDHDSVSEGEESIGEDKAEGDEEAELEFEGDDDDFGGSGSGSEDGSFSLSDPESQSHEIGSDDEPQPSDEDFEDNREESEENEDEGEEELLIDEDEDAYRVQSDEDDAGGHEKEQQEELQQEHLDPDANENIYEEIQLVPEHRMEPKIAVEVNVATPIRLHGISKTGSKSIRKVKSTHAAKTVSQFQAQQVVKQISHNAVAAIAQSLSSQTVATALTSNEKSLTEIKINQYISAGKVRTVNQAQLALKLIDMNFTEDESMAAATECSSLYTALCFLQQECLLCAGKFCAKQMISMLQCVHRCCRTCASEYFMVQIRDHPIIDLTCPFCKEPSNLNDDPAATTDYFSQLDIVLKDLLSERYHEMFQRKLRDWTLAKVPNFKWCSKCSSGFIMEPMQTRLVCPDCSAVTCAICLEEWDKVNHDHKDRRRGESLDLCDDDEHDSQPPLKSIVNFLNENCIQCPSCKQRFTLARGGCMHLTCTQCHFEFCSGCGSQFRMGSKCSENAFCQKLGLHAHHPRNCLFYLRDKEPEMLRKLLDENKIPYNKEDTQTTKNSPETETAAAGKGQTAKVKAKCQVPILRETENGTEDDLCGQEACAGHETVCLVHYVEYLGLLIWQNGLDPISLLNNDDLETIIKRAHKRLPRKLPGSSDAGYRPLLLKVIEDEIPL